MSILRVELIAGHQVLSCEKCEFGVFSVIRTKCPQCGSRFDQIRFVAADGRMSLINTDIDGRKADFDDG